jgi:hypothetical protein
VQQEYPKGYPSLLDETDDKAADRQTASLGGVAITLLLLVVGLFLVHELHTNDAIGDGLMAGRVNYSLLVATSPDRSP